MAQDVTLDVIGRFDQIERQLRSVFGKPQSVRVQLDRTFDSIQSQVQSRLSNIPLKFSNTSISPQTVGGIKKSLQTALNASPLYVNNVVLGRAGAASLRRSVQAAMSTVVVPGGGQGGRGGGGGNTFVNPLGPGGRGGGGKNLPLGRLSSEANEFSKSLDAASARVIAFGATAIAINLVRNAIRDVVVSTIELDKALREINVLLGLTNKDLQTFGADLFNIARQTATGFDVVSQAALEFSRQGLSVEETLKRTTAALNLTRLSGLDSVKAVDALTTALNSFVNEGLTAIEVTDKLAAVDAIAATSAGGLAEGVSRVGSAAADAGVSFDELLALIASAKQITGRSESVIGNAFKTIFTRLERSKVREVLGDVISIEEDDSAVDILQKLAKNYDKLSRSQQAYVAEITAGVFQINQFKAIISDLGSEFSIFDRSLNAAGNSAGISNKRVAELTQSLSDLLQVAGTNLQQGAAGVGGKIIESPFRDVLTGFNDFSQSIRDIGQRIELGQASDFEKIGADIGNGILKGISGVLTGPGLALASLLAGKILLEISKFASRTIPTLLNLNRQRLVTEQQILATYQAQNAALGIQTRLSATGNQQRAVTAAQPVGKQGKGGTTGGSLIIAGLLAPIIAETVASTLIKQEDKSGRGSAALVGAAGQVAGVGLTGFALGGPALGILATLATSIASLNKVLDAFTSEIPDYQKRLDSATKNLTEFDALSTSILTLKAQYDDLISKGADSSKAQGQLAKIQEQLSKELAKLSPDLRKQFLNAPNFEKRQSLLTGESQELAREKSFEDIALALKLAKEERDASLRSTSGARIAAAAGGPESLERFDAQVNEKFFKQVREAGEQLGKNSLLTSEELKNLADNGRTAGLSLKILGVDSTSSLGQAVTAISDAQFAVQDFGRSIRKGAQDFQKGIKEVQESFKRQIKLNVPEGAFFRNKTAEAGRAELEGLRGSTTTNRGGLDNTAALKIGAFGITDQFNMAVENAFDQALKRNEVIKGDIANVRQQAELSGLTEAEVTKIVEQYVNTNRLAQEFLTNNRIALGETTTARTGAILGQSQISGISSQEQQGFIEQAVLKSLQQGSPEEVQKIINQLANKQTRLTGTQDQVESQRSDIKATIAALQVFVDSFKANKPQAGALLDTVAAVNQKIDSATIDVVNATISIPQLASLPAFVERERSPQRNSPPSFANPFVDSSNQSFSSINLPQQNLFDKNAFFPDTESALPAEEIIALKNSLVALTDTLKTTQGSTAAGQEIAINLPISIATGNDQTANEIQAVSKEAFDSFKQQLINGLAAKGINIKFIPTATPKN